MSKFNCTQGNEIRLEVEKPLKDTVETIKRETAPAGDARDVIEMIGNAYIPVFIIAFFTALFLESTTILLCVVIAALLVPMLMLALTLIALKFSSNE